MNRGAVNSQVATISLLDKNKAKNVLLKIISLQKLKNA